MLVKPNQKVKAGNVLWNADLTYIKENALDENIIVVFTKLKMGPDLKKNYGKFNGMVLCNSSFSNASKTGETMRSIDSSHSFLL